MFLNKRKFSKLTKEIHSNFANATQNQSIKIDFFLYVLILEVYIQNYKITYCIMSIVYK